MNPDDIKVIVAGGTANVGAIGSWLAIAHDILSIVGSIVALTAGIISILVFLKNQKKGNTNATIQSDLKGPAGNMRLETTINTERSDKAD